MDKAFTTFLDVRFIFCNETTGKRVKTEHEAVHMLSELILPL